MNMKRTLLLGLLLLLLMPSAVFAHSKLDSAVPAPDASIAASPELISLTFNTKIENLSKFTLTNSADEEITIEPVTVDNDTMSSNPSTPLPNDTYAVNWTIIGADGHMVQGKYSFTVAAPTETAAPTEEPVAPTASPSESPTAEPAPEEQQQAQPSASPAAPADTDNKESNSSTPLYVIGAIIIVAAVIILFARRRKS